MRAGLLLVVLVSACGGGEEISDEAGALSQPLDSTTRQRRAKRFYASPVIARMWMPGNQKTVGSRSAAQVAKVLERGKPTFVSGLIRLNADPDLDSQAAAFADFRSVRLAMPGVPFDVCLN